MRLRARCTTLAGLLLAGCGLSPVIETSREVPLPPPAVEERVSDAIRDLGLGEPRSMAGGRLGVSLPHARTAWTSCPPQLVSGPDDERRVATAARRRGEVSVALAPLPPSGTRVDVTTRFIGIYRNQVTGYTFETPCRSSGVIEERLLGAAGGAG